MVDTNFAERAAVEVAERMWADANIVAVPDRARVSVITNSESHCMVEVPQAGDTQFPHLVLVILFVCNGGVGPLGAYAIDLRDTYMVHRDRFDVISETGKALELYRHAA